MSSLLETLGRGLLGRLDGAFASVLGLDTDDTLEALETAVETNPEDVDQRIRLAGRYLRADDPSAARRLFLSVLTEDESHTAARIGLACALDDLGQIDQALEQLKVVQQNGPAGAAVLFCIGYCHERCNRPDEAIRHYQDALAACPTLRNAHERLAAIYLKRDQYPAAIAHYKELCRLDPDRTDLHLTLANLMLLGGDGRSAVQRYGHAITLEPDNWSAHDDEAGQFESAGLIREAIEKLHERVEADPDNSETRLRLGDLYARIGNDAAATRQYATAVEIAPEYLEANVKLGTQHLRGGRHTDAAKYFAQALELNDRLLTAYIGLGVAQRATGRNDEALQSFDLARNIEPNSTLLFSEVARMQLKASAAQAADKVLQAVTDEPEAPSARSAAHDSDLISVQIERHRQAAEQRPNHADIHYRLGLLFRNRGQVDEAIASFRRATEINPGYVKALVKLGLALREVGKDDEAITIFTDATRVKPDYVDLHYQLGLLFVQRHKFELAVEHFGAAARGNPENVDFQANLALALQNMGLVDRAQATWQIVNDLAPAESEYAKQAEAALKGKPAAPKVIASAKMPIKTAKK